MPHLRTDDGPRKLRAVWLGPKGATLPFEWTYVQWLVTLLAVPLVAVVSGAVLRLLGAPGWVQVVALFWGGAGGAYLAVKAMRNVTFDEPLKHKTATVRSEFSRTRTPAAKATSWVWPPIPLSDLPGPAVQILHPRRDT